MTATVLFSCSNSAEIRLPSITFPFSINEATPRHTPNGLRPKFQLICAKTARRFEAVPTTRNARIDAQTVRFRPNAEYIMRAAVIRPCCRAGQPGNSRVARTWRVSRICRLPLHVWLQLTHFSAVVVCRRHRGAVVFVSAIAVTQKCIQPSRPNLCVVENAGIFLDAGIEDDGAHHVDGCFDEWGAQSMRP